MSKTLLIESMKTTRYEKSNGLKIENSKNPNCLGSLKGICADYLNPTRNGRKYPEDLWDNVIASDNFIEAMETKTMFGENDHPETRADTSIKEISVVLTDLWKNEKKGTIEGIFDIVDTPQGRILKTLVDYGCQLGVSSRGLGDQVERNGETIIDPDTYEFYAFDIVVQPAVITARPEVVNDSNTTHESFKRHHNTLRRNNPFRRIIEASKSIDELETIRRIVEASNLPDSDSIIESVNHKIQKFSIGGDTISPGLERDLGILAESNESLKDKVANLRSELSAKNIRIRDLTENAKSNKREITRSNNKVESLTRKIEELEKSNSHKSRLITQLTGMRNKDTDMLKRAHSKITYLENSLHSLDNEMESLKSTNAVLSHQMTTDSEKSDEIVQRLQSENNKLSDRNTLLEKRIVSLEGSSIKREETSKTLSETTLKYLDLKCSKFGLNKGTVAKLLPKEYTTADIDRVVEELSDKNDRFNKVPLAVDYSLFGMMPTKKVSLINESANKDSSEDYDQTMRFLTESKKQF